MSEVKVKQLLSRPIPWADAKKMMTAYENSGLDLPGPDGKKLKGLRVSRKDIEDIFDQGPEIVDIGMFFGLREVNGEDCLTTILVGIENDGSTGKLATSLAVDFCEPCPNHCPVE